MGNPLSMLATIILSVNVALAWGRDMKDERLIGWRGESPIDQNASMTGFGSNIESGLVVLSWRPRIFLYKKFLTDQEADELIERAKSRLQRSGVSDSTTGAGKLSDIRTSSGMFYTRSETPTIERIEERIARVTMTEPDQGEGIQVLRYDKTQRYDPHHDYFSHDHADENGGNRLVTGLMYLNDVEDTGAVEKIGSDPETAEYALLS